MLHLSYYFRLLGALLELTLRPHDSPWESSAESHGPLLSGEPRCSRWGEVPGGAGWDSVPSGATFQAKDLKPCGVWLEHSVSLVLCVFNT